METYNFFGKKFKLKKINIKKLDFHKKGYDTISHWETLEKCDGFEDYDTDLIKKMMKHSDMLDPITISYNNKVLDGFHRLTALNELGIKKIKVFKEKKCLFN